jgi:hypothetical protein
LRPYIIYFSLCKAFDIKLEAITLEEGCAKLPSTYKINFHKIFLFDMATLVLSSLGGAIGSQFGSFGTMMGQLAGNLLGSAIDQHLFPSEIGQREGVRLQELTVQNSAYGHMIPIIYGTMRLAGNIIWAIDIRETPNHHYIDYGGKNSAGQMHTQYSYSVSLAIAICEGEISRVNNIWADDQLLDGYNYQYRIYNGNEAQEADHLIEAIEGIAPAYRGLAYVVFENFPLTAFGNRLPTFSFEVTRKVKIPNTNLLKPENLVQSITIIPGAGEFVYDTITQYKQHVDNSGEYTVPRGNKICLNRHIDLQKTNAILAIEDLKYTLPKVNWVAPVVSWFATDTDIAKCHIIPAVEFKESSMSFPDPWQVNKFNRLNAPKVLYNNNQPIYGGTPSDAGVVRFLQHLKQEGYNIMFYPMLFVNQLHKPWRGRISGDSGSVAEFFNNKQYGYNNFILHYAKLVGQYVDAFVIGSELIGLTSIRDNERFPAVEQLCLLAEQVREIIPNMVKITYAADWSEYHHTNAGWYNLDPLWAHPALDFIGIDAYFPLTENQQEIYDIDIIKHGWQSGEGYDFYYEDVQRKIKKPLSPAYAWKNIRWWWENKHVNLR